MNSSQKNHLLFILLNFYSICYAKQACDAEKSLESPARWICDPIVKGEEPYCIYAPYNCRYWLYSQETLMAKADAHRKQTGRPLWLFVGGDSRVRGMVLYILDMLTASSNLTTSAFYKCWGYIDFRTHSLRITWHDMRPVEKDTARRPSSSLLPGVRRDFRSAMRDDEHEGAWADVVALEYGFDVMPDDFNGTKRIELSGFNYWRAHALATGLDWDEALATRIDGYTFFDTRKVTESQMDHMCDEGVDRKHFHTACGERLCGYVNEMLAQLLLNVAFGAPDADSPRARYESDEERAERYEQQRRSAPSYRICWSCPSVFSQKYHQRSRLPKPTCTHNGVERVFEPNDRERCVASHSTIDGRLHSVAARHPSYSVTGRLIF